MNLYLRQANSQNWQLEVQSFANSKKRQRTNRWTFSQFGEPAQDSHTYVLPLRISKKPLPFYVPSSQNMCVSDLRLNFELELLWCWSLFLIRLLGRTPERNGEGTIIWHRTFIFNLTIRARLSERLLFCYLETCAADLLPKTICPPHSRFAC